MYACIHESNSGFFERVCPPGHLRSFLVTHPITLSFANGTVPALRVRCSSTVLLRAPLTVRFLTSEVFWVNRRQWVPRGADGSLIG